MCDAGFMKYVAESVCRTSDAEGMKIVESVLEGNRGLGGAMRRFRSRAELRRSFSTGRTIGADMTSFSILGYARRRQLVETTLECGLGFSLILRCWPLRYSSECEADSSCILKISVVATQIGYVKLYLRGIARGYSQQLCRCCLVLELKNLLSAALLSFSVSSATRLYIFTIAMSAAHSPLARYVPIAVLAFFLLHRQCAADPPRCYYPDGTEAVGHVVCNSAADNTTENASSCCYGYGNAYCTQNGLCLYGGIVTRTSCTDKTWKSLKCPRVCTNGKVSCPNDGHFLVDLTEDFPLQTANANQAMNLFPCHAASVWQCEWGNCLDNFTLSYEDLSIVARDLQAPDAVNAIPFANNNTKYTPVSAIAAKTASTTPTSSCAAQGNATQSTNVLPVAVGIAIPLGLLLIGALSLAWYYRQRALRSSGSGQRQNGHATNIDRPWQNSQAKQAYVGGIGEMSDTGPMPELKSPGMPAHELAGNGGRNLV